MNEQIIIPWVGGFLQSNPAFKYPHPDLSSLPMLDNMANIPKLQRQMPAKWPEFSWPTENNTDKRCYQMFAPYISRIGYTAEGRVYSIICPQQGAYIENLLNLNVEVTVTGQRGWVDEPSRETAADMTVTGKIWFSPFGNHPGLQRILERLKNSEFPFTKAHAIEVKTSDPGSRNPIFGLRKGICRKFPNPNFARHDGEAYTAGNVEVEIGGILATGDTLIDDFNEIVYTIFNILSGNMLEKGNTLSWNIWFAHPKTVDTTEWVTHAERWRKSIDIRHDLPHGEGTAARYYDGSPLRYDRKAVLDNVDQLLEYLYKHAPTLGLDPEDIRQAQTDIQNTLITLNENIL